MYLIPLDPKVLKTLSPYIVWDGSTIMRYWPTKGHDCVVLNDGLVSVQNIRRDCILSGVEPIVIFSCKRGMPSYEVKFPNGKWGGLFTQSYLKVLDENPNVNIKDLITKTNNEMSKTGLNQTCEVICRKVLLDMEYLHGKHPGVGIAYLQYDMCRTPGDWGLKIANK